MIAATNMNIESKVTIDQRIVIEPDFEPIEIPPPIPPKKPAPHKPSVLNVIPDDDLIEPDPIAFTDFDNAYGDSIALPPGQTTIPEEDIRIFAEFMPEMKGGITKLYSEITYPKQAKIAGIQGKVTVQFLVNKKGEVENPRILRGIGGGCDEEVLRAIKLMKFSPGIQNGDFVRVKMTQPVIFKLQN
jgi:protein TonB